MATKSHALPMPTFEPPRPARAPLSVAGQWIGWGAWGTFVLLGFCFGVWAGTRSSTAKPTVEVADATQAKTETPAKLEPKKDELKPPPKMEAPKKEPPKKVEPPPMAEVVAMTPTPPKTEEPRKEPPKTEPPKTEPPPAAVAMVSFKTDILPIFRQRCIVCHEGPKAKQDLRLVSIDAIMKGSSGGDVLKVGDLKKSTLWTTVEDGSMPPEGKPQLTAEEKKLLKDWILGGAKP